MIKLIQGFTEALGSRPLLLLVHLSRRPRVTFPFKVFNPQKNVEMVFDLCRNVVTVGKNKS